VTAHIVMPARESHVPDALVRRCTGCQWVEYRPRAERDELDRLAAEHRANPAGTEAAEATP
jgi:hypothetical protein